MKEKRKGWKKQDFQRDGRPVRGLKPMPSPDGWAGPLIPLFGGGVGSEI